MTATFWSILLSFLLVTIIGGLFAQRLQHRNWIRQQYISQQEKLIAELKSIFVELDALLSRRLYRTRRLLYALRRPDAKKIKSAVREYDKVITEWNEKRNSFQIRLVRVIDVSLAQDFEHQLSHEFVRIGLKLERMVRTFANDQLPKNFRDTLTELEVELEFLSRSIYEFMREIYKALQKEQQELFYVDQFNNIPDDGGKLDHISTWFLFKSLFVPPPKRTEES